MSSRLNAAVCEDVALNVQFLENGQSADPLALCSVKIYKCSVTDENLVTTITFPAPASEDYDLTNEFIYGGLIQRCNGTTDGGDCGTDVPVTYTPGCFILNLNLCPDLFEANTYFDVWCFVGNDCDPCVTGTDVTATDLCDNEDAIIKQCNKFFVKDSAWFVDDGLKNIQLGFEAITSRFQQPEKRYYEVGLTPLPLYDFDVAKMNQIIPGLNATITIMTAHCCEILVDAEPMTVGLRSGTFRSNPYVLRYLLDSTKFLKGTYQARVDVSLPDGQTRSSPLFNVAIR